MQLDPSTRLVALTGAGISAESGIKTFRDGDGLWEQHRVEDVATPEAFIRDPGLVWRFYIERFRQARDAKPNQAHTALASLEAYLGNNYHLITQNVDGLHSRAGSQRLTEMHGSLDRCLCQSCGKTHPMPVELDGEKLPACGKCGGLLRPDIVWFGEIPYHLDRIQSLLRMCDVFLLVGSSGVVYPAAGFIQTAKYLGARTIAVNLQPTEKTHFVDEFYQGKAGEILPRLVSTWIGNSPAQ